MNNELAKKLKEAGFPQFGRSGTVATPSIIQMENGITDMPYIPSLEELIEACGDRFGELENTFDGWRAYPALDDIEKETHWAKTPIEAVANLYIVLHEKRL